jgi:hypothetical protein
MPRRQRFKPSRKPKPAIEPSESEIIQPTRSSSEATSQEQSTEERQENVPH